MAPPRRSPARNAADSGRWSTVRTGAGECLFDAVLRDALDISDGLGGVESGGDAVARRLLLDGPALAAADDHGARGEESRLRGSADARHIPVAATREQERAVLDGVAAHDVDLAPLVHRDNGAVQIGERPENRHDRLDRVDRARHRCRSARHRETVEVGTSTPASSSTSCTMARTDDPDALA